MIHYLMGVAHEFDVAVGRHFVGSNSGRHGHMFSDQRFDIDVVLGATNCHDGSRGALADWLPVVLVDGPCGFLGDFA